MIKLPAPYLEAKDCFAILASGIHSEDLKTAFSQSLPTLISTAQSYKEKASRAELYLIQPIPDDTTTPALHLLTKTQLLRLYDYHLRDNTKPGRKIYEKIISAAREKCPFCGGIGRPRNLDHFLPKSNFPQFSIVPLNLIPCCRDCNMDSKMDEYATSQSEQIIHPYLEKDSFFNERWIRGRISSNSPWTVDFFASPPENWSRVDKQRAESHFQEFNLAKRYSILSAEEISVLIDQRNNIMSSWSKSDFKSYLRSFQSSTLPINHWKRALYSCLEDDNAFVESSLAN